MLCMYVRSPMYVYMLCMHAIYVTPCAISRRPLTVEDRVRAQVSPRGICGGSGTGTGLFS
jgi:hypothetical protein